MRVMSLHRFIQKASEPQEVLAMPVREFLNAIATQCEDTCTAIVTLDSPEPNSISVKFFQPGVERVDAENLDAPPEDQQGRLITVYEGGMSDFKAELFSWSDNFTVTATTTISGTAIWVKIAANDDGGSD